MPVATKVFSFTYGDISDTAGISKATIYSAVSKGQLNPDNLDSLVEFIALRKYPKLRESTEEMSPREQLAEAEKVSKSGLQLLGITSDQKAIFGIHLGPKNSNQEQILSTRAEHARVTVLLNESYKYGVWTSAASEEIQGWVSHKRR